LKLLTGGTRDADGRQRTLRKTIEWNYDLLDPVAQDLFARLSCFVGGCTLEAAEGTCDADLDALDGLVRQSLLRSSPSAAGPRFTMLETIREYAADRLRASGLESEWRARHSRWFLSWADQAERGLSSEEQAWLARIAEDHDNVRAALAWLVQHDRRARSGSSAR
jgi:predicted ATPase